MALTDAQPIGEQHVIDWLKASEYKWTRDADAGVPGVLLADGKQARLVVRVEAGEHPKEISSTERAKLVARASSLGDYQAWIAKVVLDDRGSLVGKIQWTKLN